MRSRYTPHPLQLDFIRQCEVHVLSEASPGAGPQRGLGPKVYRRRAPVEAPFVCQTSVLLLPTRHSKEGPAALVAHVDRVHSVHCR